MENIPSVRVGILGCGNVGAALVALLWDKSRDIADRAGLNIEIVGVAVANLYKPRPLVPEDFPQSLYTYEPDELVENPGIDVIVELMGGLEPAGELVSRAIESGKSVVTANKALLADRGSELASAAGARGVDLLYEAAVGGAIPIIRPLRESLAAEGIRRITGIINGTTNYILTAMIERGADYGEALEEAQDMGYAERDPAADVEGEDAAAKVAILSGLAFGCEVRSGDVVKEGISGVRAIDVGYAAKLGYAVKLLAVAELLEPGVARDGSGDGSGGGLHGPASGGRDRDEGDQGDEGAGGTEGEHGAEDVNAGAAAGRGSELWELASDFDEESGADSGADLVGAGGISRRMEPGMAERGEATPGRFRPERQGALVSARVYPAMVPMSHPLASVRESFNAVFVEGMSCGQLMWYGQGAGGFPTASAVLGDLIDAAKGRALERRHLPPRPFPRARIAPPGDLRCPWYLNIEVADRPGVLATVAKVFGDNGVSIRSMEQVGLADDARLVFLTHAAREESVMRTIETLQELPVVENVGGVLRIFEEEQAAGGDAATGRATGGDATRGKAAGGDVLAGAIRKDGAQDMRDGRRQR